MQKTIEQSPKQHLVTNLFNLAYQPVSVGKNPTIVCNKYFKTLTDAITQVSQHVMIKLCKGIYNQRVKIMKPDIKIQSTQITENTIIVNQQHCNLLIDLPHPTSKLHLQHLKLINLCQNPQKHKIKNGNYQSLRKQTYSHFQISQDMNTCLYIKCGTVQMDQCKISMATYHNSEMALPCIVVGSRGSLIITRSEIVGGAGTVGIFSNGGKIIMKESLIRDHGISGILFCSRNPKNSTSTISIKNSQFTHCNQAITLDGIFDSSLQNNTISSSASIGLVITNGNECRVKNNDIKLCKQGLEIKNSFPVILKNTITNNQDIGCHIKSTGGILCRPILKFNTINENSNGGVLIEGSLNTAKLQNNHFNYNNNYSIKIQNRAFPHIFLNKINNTLGNGILVLKNSSVFLQKNQIQLSLESNLVLQGPNNFNNFIFRNYIAKARSQGIFTIYGQKFIIKDNQIQNNHNGIVSVTGVQTIQNNIIRNNTKNGILLLRDNNLQITDNQIQTNKKSGLLIRDTSIGTITDNYFSKNKTQIVIQSIRKNFDRIQYDNVFEQGYDIRVPRNYGCQII